MRALTITLLAVAVAVVVVLSISKRGESPAKRPSTEAKAGGAPIHARLTAHERLKVLREDFRQRHRHERAEHVAVSVRPTPHRGARASRRQPAQRTGPAPGWDHWEPEYGPEYEGEVGELESTILNDPDPAARVRALADLSDVARTEDAVRMLVNALADRSAEVRVAAVQLLGYYEDEISVSQLEPALRDSDPEVRFAALSTLDEVENPGALAAARDALNDPDDEVRELAEIIVEAHAEDTASR